MQKDLNTSALPPRLMLQSAGDGGWRVFSSTGTGRNTVHQHSAPSGGSTRGTGNPRTGKRTGGGGKLAENHLDTPAGGLSTRRYPLSGHPGRLKYYHDTQELSWLRARVFLTGITSGSRFMKSMPIYQTIVRTAIFSNCIRNVSDKLPVFQV
jgi:hypothetical protein